METTWIEVGGLTIRAPVTAGTNLALAVQCLLYYRFLRTGPSARSVQWSGFFMMMAVATLAGVVKHGFRHELAPSALLLMLWASNVAGGISTHFAQRATLVSHASEGITRRVSLLVDTQLVLFLTANIVMGPELPLLIVNTAVGLLPVIGAEARAARRGHAGSAWTAGGLSVSIGTGVVYIAELAVGPWLNHIDVAHLLMGLSFWMMLRGARPRVVSSGTPTSPWMPTPTMTTDPGGL